MFFKDTILFLLEFSTQTFTSLCFKPSNYQYTAPSPGLSVFKCAYQLLKSFNQTTIFTNATVHSYRIKTNTLKNIFF